MPYGCLLSHVLRWEQGNHEIEGEYTSCHISGSATPPTTRFGSGAAASSHPRSLPLPPLSVCLSVCLSQLPPLPPRMNILSIYLQSKKFVFIFSISISLSLSPSLCALVYVYAFMKPKRWYQQWASNEWTWS